mmetsp:Transcript_76191/g.176760  ORF Transcript_76191/g.176760 Transcript_76191/m.176760 type:complete len:258 (+) Transcript_76191:82-855(+)
MVASVSSTRLAPLDGQQLWCSESTSSQWTKGRPLSSGGPSADNLPELSPGSNGLQKTSTSRFWPSLSQAAAVATKPAWVVQNPEGAFLGVRCTVDGRLVYFAGLIAASVTEPNACTPMKSSPKAFRGYFLHATLPHPKLSNADSCVSRWSQHRCALARSETQQQHSLEPSMVSQLLVVLLLRRLAGVSTEQLRWAREVSAVSDNTITRLDPLNPLSALTSAVAAGWPGPSRPFSQTRAPPDLPSFVWMAEGRGHVQA